MHQAFYRLDQLQYLKVFENMSIYFDENGLHFRVKAINIMPYGEKNFMPYIQYFSKPGDTLSGRRLVLPRLASPRLALPCLVMPCLVLPGFECDAFSSNIKNWIHMVMLFWCIYYFIYNLINLSWCPYRQNIDILWYFEQKHRFIKDICWWLGT